MDLSRARLNAIFHRLPPPVRKLVVDEFNRLYYASGQTTWQTTQWMGADVWKPPSDLWVMQEILYETKPDLLIETGIHLGGSTLYFGDLFERMGDGRVIAVDIHLTHADKRVFEHSRIEVIQGSSTDPEIVAKLREAAEGKRVMVNLDSDHSADHVVRELELLGPLVSEGCYLIVEDTNLNGHPIKSWPYGDGPMEALERWHPNHPEFVTDKHRERLMLTFNPNGYLKRRAIDR
jgi:cephalosporin hydroxylase